LVRLREIAGQLEYAACPDAFAAELEEIASVLEEFR
jgi:hypothetical protein